MHQIPRIGDRFRLENIVSVVSFVSRISSSGLGLALVKKKKKKKKDEISNFFLFQLKKISRNCRVKELNKSLCYDHA